MNTDEKEIKELIERAKFDIEADNIEEASYKLRKAMEIATNIGNKELENKIVEFFESISYTTKPQLIELNPIITEGFILDIGGGGEGIIGKLNGKKVIAIDKNENELL